MSADTELPLREVEPIIIGPKPSGILHYRSAKSLINRVCDETIAAEELKRNTGFSTDSRELLDIAHENAYDLFIHNSEAVIYGLSSDCIKYIGYAAEPTLAMAEHLINLRQIFRQLMELEGPDGSNDRLFEEQKEQLLEFHSAAVNTILTLTREFDFSELGEKSIIDYHNDTGDLEPLPYESDLDTCGALAFIYNILGPRLQRSYSNEWLLSFKQQFRGITAEVESIKQWEASEYIVEIASPEQERFNVDFIATKEQTGEVKLVQVANGKDELILETGVAGDYQYLVNYKFSGSAEYRTRLINKFLNLRYEVDDVNSDNWLESFPETPFFQEMAAALNQIIINKDKFTINMLANNNHATDKALVTAFRQLKGLLIQDPQTYSMLMAVLGHHFERLRGNYSFFHRNDWEDPANISPRAQEVREANLAVNALQSIAQLSLPTNIHKTDMERRYLVLKGIIEPLFESGSRFMYFFTEDQRKGKKSESLKIKQLKRLSPQSFKKYQTPVTGILHVAKPLLLKRPH